jgi:pantoate--beta-alanine ligase
MEIAKNNFELSKWLKDRNVQSLDLGFVPTMGALHEGHLSLIKQAINENKFIVVSIFVNPKQFNNPLDLERYPRTLEKDIVCLRTLSHENILVYTPSEEDVYKDAIAFNVDLGMLDHVLEGEFRPGHFQGVAHVVHNLFQLIRPGRAYFGKKDFQQLAVIRRLVQQIGFNTEIVACPTLRSEDGLALSSRNSLLTSKERSDALIIIRTLLSIQEWSHTISPQQTKENAITFFRKGALDLEYLEIIDGNTFITLSDEWGTSPVCCIAAYCGSVRLIDNIELYQN